ncbi:uncharacterized protein LOC132190218 isoform X2 [Corylus avellana]|uniref:uncharacterized protein LOC132190218 isoform X2 n=1 Tax=Corylus avellana TaxID=13451 RepID=UPI00286B8211|nr:uncharacterized protein LOC132190218 isoform X2 [Corylus avellana]
MKLSGLWVLFLVVGTAFLFLNFPCTVTASFVPETAVGHHGDGMAMTITSRRLKENGKNPVSDKKSDVGKVILEDYRPIDPVPCSKASIRPGPIQHGTPLMPYIPGPSPPSQPRNR